MVKYIYSERINEFDFDLLQGCFMQVNLQLNFWKIKTFLRSL